jgi:uncharacterized membrane protein
MKEISLTVEDMLRFVGLLFDVIGVAVIVIGFAFATFRLFRNRTHTDSTRQYRIAIGRALLLALEILVAADIIRTVAVELTLQNLAALGLLVIIRTFLSWSLGVEVDGRFPWQREATSEGT